jgi:hypothetical protein
MKSLQSYIEQGGHIKFPYLRLNPSWDGSLADDNYIVIAAIKLDTLKDLITAYRLTERTLRQALQSSKLNQFTPGNQDC